MTCCLWFLPTGQGRVRSMSCYSIEVAYTSSCFISFKRGGLFFFKKMLNELVLFIKPLPRRHWLVSSFQKWTGNGSCSVARHNARMMLSSKNNKSGLFSIQVICALWGKLLWICCLDSKASVSNHSSLKMLLHFWINWWACWNAQRFNYTQRIEIWRIPRGKAVESVV